MRAPFAFHRQICLKVLKLILPFILNILWMIKCQKWVMCKISTKNMTIIFAKLHVQRIKSLMNSFVLE